ncbi:protein tramtrack, beta isoform [Drosophila novamexicana]|uniref:protein tramtrack, beta isoform n=1 Tax=Drosophila novamexicana TaxID=47314 RepID=UPI0011E5BAEE|nr:protein tramtrack, beta isoform [Drosophila novamexicana]
MNHLKWMGHSSTIMDIQRVLLHQQSNNQQCEVLLVAKDGISVRAHLFVLSTCSDLMRNLLVDLPAGQEATVILPDIRGELLESMLSFIYMGETSLPSALLTEFLEAINLLGIKSAISFETNPTAMTTSNVISGAMAVEAAKSISGLHIANTALMEEEEEEDASAVVGKLEVGNAVLANPQQQHEQEGRTLEFLDVYGEQPKITYSIEHMGGTSSGNQYILTENTGTFTITQSASSVAKLGVAGSSAVVESVATGEMGDDDAEAENTDEQDESESQLIEEEYVGSGDPLIEMTADADVDMHEDGMHEGEPGDEEEDDELLDVKPRKVHLDMNMIKAKARQRPMSAKVTKKTMTKQYQQHAALKKESKDDINDALDLAAAAVLHEGLSLQKAADRYDISKTVLWRRVRSNPAYMRIKREKPSLSEAYERLKNGDSLKSISQDLHIPMSTLHRHKVRLAEQGRLPDFVACRRRDSTPKDELRDKLAKAVHACINGGMSQNHAANLFEIPKSTLWRHLQRRVTEAERKVKEEQEEDEDEDVLN